jgi:MFS family permease
MPVYSISVAYANDYADRSEYVRVSAGLLLVYGLGAIAGPFLASALMTWHNASGLFWFAASAHVLLIGFISYRFIKEGNQAKEPIAFSDALAAAQTTSQVYEEELGE